MVITIPNDAELSALEKDIHIQIEVKPQGSNRRWVCVTVTPEGYVKLSDSRITRSVETPSKDVGDIKDAIEAENALHFIAAYFNN